MASRAVGIFLCRRRRPPSSSLPPLSPLSDGRNDGTIDGIEYFRCTPRHGVFVRPANLTRLPDQQEDDESALENLDSGSNLAGDRT